METKEFEPDRLVSHTSDTEAGSVREMAEDYLKPREITVGRPGPKQARFVALGKDLELHRLDDELLRPSRRSGVATFTTLDSFTAHLERFKSEKTVVFADDDRNAPKLVSVIDYHGSGEAPAEFTDHRGVYSFPLSEEWKTWTKHNGEAMEMVEFARFLEDHIVDIDIPESEVPESLDEFVVKLGGRDRIATPQQLVDIAANLSINENSTLKRAHNLSSGEAQIEFSDEHETAIGGKTIKMPSMFMLAIPVFRRGDFYRILARLRYRKKGSLVVFYYEMVRPDKSLDHAIFEATETVKSAADVPVFFGSPEA